MLGVVSLVGQVGRWVERGTDERIKLVAGYMSAESETKALVQKGVHV